MPKNSPEIVDLPPVNYIAVRGRGDPNAEGGDYQKAIGILYAVAYTLKMSYKTGYRIEGFFDYVVPPLEGFWQQNGRFFRKIVPRQPQSGPPAQKRFRCPQTGRPRLLPYVPCIFLPSALPIPPASGQSAPGTHRCPAVKARNHPGLSADFPECPLFCQSEGHWADDSVPALPGAG